MSHAERVSWDQHFRVGDHASREPDPFLLRLNDYQRLFPPGRNALELACGAGRHAVWLVENGWNVTACDVSMEGLRRAQALAAERGVRLMLCCLDLDNAVWPADRFDLIVCFFYLRRELFPALKAALRPGGLVVYKTYTNEGQGAPSRPSHPLHLLRPQELLDAFRDFRVLHYEETVQGRGLARLIARKS
jgi:SAM-dependent methyltransferase